MKIGVDASCWANKRGYGRYARELLSALLATDRRNEYRLFLDAETAEQVDDLPDGVEQVIVGTSRAAATAASASGNRSLRDLWAMRKAVQRHGSDLDVFYFPSVYTYFPVKTNAKVVVTIHDTTAEQYPRLIFGSRRNQLLWKLKVWMAVRRADIIATVSHASKKQIIRQFGVEEERVLVVSDAVGSEFHQTLNAGEVVDAAARYGVGPVGGYFLYVGGISPHKNLDTLIGAFAESFAGSSSAASVALVGDYEGDVFYSSYDALRKKIASLGSEDKVVFTGYVKDADLVRLYAGAAAVVMPSFDEGFGLPALEAMACGAPIIASQAGALPEVIGNAGLLFDPYSSQELAAHLKTVFDDKDVRDEMSRKGLERAKAFSWQRSAAAAQELFEGLTGAYESSLA